MSSINEVSETARLLFKLIANRTTRVMDRLGIPISSLPFKDIEWLYNAIGLAWKMEQEEKGKADDA